MKKVLFVALMALGAVMFVSENRVNLGADNGSQPDISILGDQDGVKLAGIIPPQKPPIKPICSLNA